MKNLCLTLLFSWIFFSCFASIGPITGTTAICTNVNSILTDTSLGGTWTSSNTSVAVISSVSGEVTGITAGTSAITYWVHAGFATTVVMINPVPAIDTVTGGGSYCAGSSGVTVVLNSSQSGVNYFLHFGTFITGPESGSGIALSFGPETTAGTYTVVAINTTTGCTDTMAGSATVSITPLDTPGVTITPSPGDSVCTGTSTLFTATPSFGGSTPVYHWRVNGTSVGSSAHTYTYIPANGDRVSVTMTSNGTCLYRDTSVDSIRMNVLILRRPSVTLSAVPGDSVCVDYPVTIVPTPSYGGSAPIYGWSLNGVMIDSGATFNYVPANGDIINCTITSNYLCLIVDTQTAMSPVAMTVIYPVIPSFSIIAVPGSTVAPGQNDTLIAVISGGAANLSYQWEKNFSTIPGATDSIYVYNSAILGTDSVSCVITSTGLCDISTSNWIFVTNSYEGIQNIKASPAYAIYPNPGNGDFVITGPASGIQSNIEIRSLTGQILYRNSLNSVAVTPLHLRGALPGGTYLLLIGSDNARQVYRLVIERD